MTREELDARFSEFAADAIVRLRPLAHATARDAHRADDLVQITLEKMYAVWPRIERTTADPMAYARTVLVRSLISQQRRVSWRNEVLVDVELSSEIFGEVGPEGPRDHGDDVAARHTLHEALRQLPPRQRMAVVLRHLEDQSVDDVARLMNCSTGTVKSTTNSGLRTLRKLLPQHALEGVDQ